MWLTSWWVAWLLNFYGFSHTNCMVFYRTPWTRYGIPWNCIGTSGNPMAFHGTLQYSLEFHGPPRKLHGISWHSMELHHYFMELRGTPWHSMELHGYSMELHGIPWNSMDTPWMFRGIPWISMDFHRIPWISIDFHGFPWNYMEVFHTGCEQSLIFLAKLLHVKPKHASGEAAACREKRGRLFLVSSIWQHRGLQSRWMR